MISALSWHTRKIYGGREGGKDDTLMLDMMDMNK